MVEVGCCFDGGDVSGSDLKAWEGPEAKVQYWSRGVTPKYSDHSGSLYGTGRGTMKK